MIQDPSEGLSECVEYGFTILYDNSNHKQNFTMQSRYAAESVLEEFLTDEVLLWV